MNIAESSSKYYHPFLNRALKLGICDMEVLRLLEERMMQEKWKLLRKRSLQDARLRGKYPPVAIRDEEQGTARTAGFQIAEVSPSEAQPPDLSLWLRSIGRVEIPKRLFRNLHSVSPASSPSSFTDFDAHDLPLLKHLFSTFCPNPNSSAGYPLAKAVLSRHIYLIKYLLSKKADPSEKDNLAIMLAVGRDDFEVVKLLIEYPADGQLEDTDHNGEGGLPGTGTEEQLLPAANGRKRRNGSLGGSPGKRRRIEDRVQSTPAMLELAVKQKCHPLIVYFMGKGVVPNMKTLTMMDQAGW